MGGHHAAKAGKKCVKNRIRDGRASGVQGAVVLTFGGLWFMVQNYIGVARARTQDAIEYLNAKEAVGIISIGSVTRIQPSPRAKFDRTKQR